MTVEIIRASDTPAVKAAVEVLERLQARLEGVRGRLLSVRTEIDSKRASPPAKDLAAAVIAGEKIDFSPPDTSRLEKELARLTREADAVAAAVDQQRLAVAAARDRVAQDLGAKIDAMMPHLQSDAAAAFLAFVLKRDAGHKLAARLHAAGFHELAGRVAGGVVLPNYGSLAESTSSVSLILSDLRKAKLIGELPC